MSEEQTKGVYCLPNGYWGYRFVITVNGQKKSEKRTRDADGNPYKTRKQAERARLRAMKAKTREIQQSIFKAEEQKKSVQEVYKEYCEKGRSGKALSTIKKQDSVWNNHLKSKFGKRYLEEITLAEIQDFLERKYYVDGKAFSYVESILKMFYLIYGQAYSRGYIDGELYSKYCKNKDTKIHMPKRRVEEDDEVVSFTESQMHCLDEHFSGTNSETAFLLGKYCGLRINECYGLKWSDIDFLNGTLTIRQQMQYIDGLVRLTPPKTRNARRTIFLHEKLQEHLERQFLIQKEAKIKFSEQREQNQKFIIDINGNKVSSLELVNTLPNGKLQTVNSMKYQARMINEKYGFTFKYHYLRHTYGTRMAEMNTPMHLLCNQMGHGNSKVTYKYYLGISPEGIKILKENLNKM